MRTFLTDILYTNDPEKSGDDRYSLARVCLFVTFNVYILCGAGYLALSLMPQYNTSPEILKTIMDNLQYALTLFAGYTFGGKALKTTQQIMTQNSNNNTTKNETEHN
jgi:hypothetical protein